MYVYVYIYIYIYIYSPSSPNPPPPCHEAGAVMAVRSITAGMAATTNVRAISSAQRLARGQASLVVGVTNIRIALMDASMATMTAFRLAAT